MKLTTSETTTLTAACTEMDAASTAFQAVVDPTATDVSTETGDLRIAAQKILDSIPAVSASVGGGAAGTTVAGRPSTLQ